MKQIIQSIFVIIIGLTFTSYKANAQYTHTVSDIFLLLPDTVFTTIQELNFGAKDSFSITERNKMKENYDAKLKTFKVSDPRFHITTINDKNNILSGTTGDLNFNVKLWPLPDNELLIAVDGNYKEDAMIYQTIKFYKYKGGKISWVKVLPEPFTVSMFFERDYIIKQKVDPNYVVPYLFIVFSKTGDELQVRIQPALFDEELQGTKGKPLTNLSYMKIKHPDLILELKEGKFVVKTK